MALAPPPGVTAQLDVNYHHLTPVDEDLRLEAWITKVRDRRVYAEATCHAGETLTARATALRKAPVATSQVGDMPATRSATGERLASCRSRSTSISVSRLG